MTSSDMTHDPRTIGPGSGYDKPLAPKQIWSIRRATRRVNVWSGAVRSGKSIAADIAWLGFVPVAPPGVLYMVGSTIDALERNVLRPLSEMVSPEVFDYNHAAGWARVGERRIDLVSAYDARSYRRIRGSTCAGFLGDELVLWPESFLRELLHRMSPPGARGFGTTNPDSPFHYLKKDFLDRAEALGWAHFHFRLEDNPYLTREFVEALRAENVGLWYQRFILGLWVLAAGTVYDHFDRDTHRRTVPRATRYYGAAVDYGAANPTAFGLFGWDEPTGPVYLLDCYYFDPQEHGRSKRNEDLADDFVAFTRGLDLAHVVSDPSALSFILELEARGFAVEGANNSVKRGIQHVASLLANSLFVISDEPCCDIVETEMGAYVWDPKAQKQGIDRPVKAHDHTLDMLRYFLLTVFPDLKPTRRVQAVPNQQHTTASGYRIAR